MNLSPEIIAILINTVDIFFRALTFLIILRILMSWLAPHAQGSIVNFIVSTTTPILDVFRRLPLRIGMIDFSPIVALLVLDFAREFLLKVIIGMA